MALKTLKHTCENCESDYKIVFDDEKVADQPQCKRKKIRVSRGWESYYGTNKVLQQDVLALGADQFTRDIMVLCNSRSECSYYETYHIFTSGALLSDKWYNDWVTCKISKRHLNGLKIA